MCVCSSLASLADRPGRIVGGPLRFIRLFYYPRCVYYLFVFVFSVCVCVWINVCITFFFSICMWNEMNVYGWWWWYTREYGVWCTQRYDVKLCIYTYANILYMRVWKYVWTYAHVITFRLNCHLIFALCIVILCRQCYCSIYELDKIRYHLCNAMLTVVPIKWTNNKIK